MANKIKKEIEEHTPLINWVQACIEFQIGGAKRRIVQILYGNTLDTRLNWEILLKNSDLIK